MRLPLACVLFRRWLVVPFGVNLCFGRAVFAFGHLVLFSPLTAQNQFLSQRLLNFRIGELRLMQFLSLWDLADEC